MSTIQALYFIYIQNPTTPVLQSDMENFIYTVLFFLQITFPVRKLLLYYLP